MWLIFNKNYIVCVKFRYWALIINDNLTFDENRMSFWKSFFDRILWSNTLYYPWCLTKALLPNIENNYEKILHELGIDFIKLSDKEYCCWSPVLRGWMRDAYEKIKARNIAIFKEHAVGRIITNCPACYAMFKFQYKLEEEYWIKVEHITTVIKQNEKKIKNKDVLKTITYHDPCHLGRLSWIYEEPRNVLKKCWYDVKEFEKNREQSMCCWGGWGLVNNNPELSEKIAKQLLSQLNDWDMLTSPCPMCYFQFKKHAKNIDVREFSEIILEQ